LSQPDPSSKIANDWFHRRGREVPAAVAAQPTAAAITGKADGGQHGAEPPRDPDAEVDRALRSAFAHSSKRL
jgi:hypothetical protein